MVIVWDKSFSSHGVTELFVSDVRILVKKYGANTKPKVACAFNEEHRDLIAKITNSGYMHVGMDRVEGKERLYFDEDPLRTDRKVNVYTDGYSHSDGSKRSYRYITLGYESVFGPWLGDFDLRYDDELGLYYIERA